MDKNTYDNWKKIKEVMEQKGTTDNYFYKRAVAIIKTGRDPMNSFLGTSE
jgi:hypothetical protein